MRPVCFLLLPVLLFAGATCNAPADPTDGSPDGPDKPVPVVEQAYAFPGAEGFGRDATGGRGGQVIYVTNLNDAGSGSLRAAVRTTGARYIVFTVSGTIALRSELKIEQGNVTIAGQTAPGDGITLRDYPVSVAADNVIIRFLRFRMGDAAKQEGDALGGRFHKNIIVDHCSMSWSTDECVSFYANENTTVQWCLIGESLRNSVHGKGAHGYGGIWGGRNASFHHNLLAHHDSRNPRLGEEAGKAFARTDRVDLRNNVIYNWGSNSAYGGEAMNVNIVNCYYKPGPATKVNALSKQGRIVSIDKNKIQGTEVYDTWGRFHVNGNYVEGVTAATADNWEAGVVRQFHGSYTTYSGSCQDVQGNTISCAYKIPVTAQDLAGMKLAEPLPVDNNVTTHTAAVAYERVLAYAGASLARDAVDLRLVQDVKNAGYRHEGSNGSTNGIIDTQSDVGAWPELTGGEPPTDTDGDGMPDDWEDAMQLDKTRPDATGKDLSTGYDNVEVYLHSLVQAIVKDQVKP